jgi:hypothetical protein
LVGEGERIIDGDNGVANSREQGINAARNQGDQ